MHDFSNSCRAARELDRRTPDRHGTHQRGHACDALVFILICARDPVLGHRFCSVGHRPRSHDNQQPLTDHVGRCVFGSQAPHAGTTSQLTQGGSLLRCHKLLHCPEQRGAHLSSGPPWSLRIFVFILCHAAILGQHTGHTRKSAAQLCRTFFGVLHSVFQSFIEVNAPPTIAERDGRSKPSPRTSRFRQGAARLCHAWTQARPVGWARGRPFPL